MGLIFSKFFKFKTEKRLLMLGLDNSGKTTILYKLKLGDVVKTVPTIGFNVESINYKNLDLTIWDLGGQDKIRPLWRHYYQGVSAIIFIVDAADRNRLNEVIDEVRILDNENILEDCVFLFYMNKMDLPNPITGSEFRLELNKIIRHTRKFYVQESCATNGMGLYEGLEWLNNKLI
jgi:small GTP-binding protein